MKISLGVLLLAIVPTILSEFTDKGGSPDIETPGQFAAPTETLPDQSSDYTSDTSITSTSSTPTSENSTNTPALEISETLLELSNDSTTDNISIVNDSLIFNSTDSENVIDNNATVSLEDNKSTESQFLSFEEWKKLKGVDSLPPQNNGEQKKVVGGSNNQDSIGEEMEIDLFFLQDDQQAQQDSQEEIDDFDDDKGKIYKDKFNYASFDCAATIVKANSEAKSANSILFENKDSYLLNPCSAPNKYIVIELCEDILVDNVVIGNFEFFSSNFKLIQISVSDVFPVSRNGWSVLGKFNAKDVRDLQSFNITNPKIWAKYLRIEILEHYGDEFYCPLSVVRVHGRTMMQEYKEESLSNKIEAPNKDEEVIVIEIDTQIVNNNNNDGSSSNNNNETLSIIEQLNCTKNESNNQIICENIENLSSANNNDNNNKLLMNDIHLNVNELNKENNSQFEKNECSIALQNLNFEDFFENFKNKSDIQCEAIVNPNDKTNNNNNNNINHSISINSIINKKVTEKIETQESIYKNIMKRLSLLESNATLSILYIEEQSKLLSNSFSSLEKNQESKFNNLINLLNDSINLKLDEMTNLYNIMHQQTESLLVSQREKHLELLNDSYNKIEILTNELKFQKILTYINLVILLIILVYVILTRDTVIDDESFISSGLISPTKEKNWLGRTILRSPKRNDGKKFDSKGYSSDEFETSQIPVLKPAVLLNDKDQDNDKKNPITPEHSDDEREE